MADNFSAGHDAWLRSAFALMLGPIAVLLMCYVALTQVVNLDVL